MPKINKWLYPGIRIKRWIFLLLLSIIVIIAGFAGVLGDVVKHVRIEVFNIDWVFYRLQRLKALDYLLLFLGIGGIILAARRAYFSMLTMFMPNREKEFINIAYRKAKLKRGPKVAADRKSTRLNSSHH